MTVKETMGACTVRILQKRFSCSLLLLILLGLFTQTFCQASAEESKPARKDAKRREPKSDIKVGFVTSLTGVGSDACNALLEGFKFYYDSVNNEVAGKHIDIVVADDRGRPTDSVSHVRRLIEKENVNVLTGVFFAPVMYAIAPVADKMEVPFVGCLSGADDITQRKPLKWFLRCSWSASQPVHPFGEYVAKKLHYNHVATIGSDYQYGYEVVGGFQQSFEKAGGQVVQKLWIPIDGTDFSPTINSLRKDIDAVFIITAGRSSNVLPGELKKARPDLPILGAMTGFDEGILNAVGDPLVGAISCNPYSTALDSPTNKKFVQAFHDKKGKNPGWFDECGYVTGMWIAQAINARHGDVSNKEQFLSALKKVHLTNAPRGPIKLDSYGNPIDNIYIRKVEKVNGTYQNTVIYTYPMVSQFWTWKPEEYLAQPLYSRTFPPCQFCTP